MFKKTLIPNHPMRVFLMASMLSAGLLIAACTPVSTNGETPTPDINQIVTATFQAMTQEAQQTAEAIPTETLPPSITQTATPFPAPTMESGVLPQAIYFVNSNDHNLYRLAVDGQTLSQITFETEQIDDFDISFNTKQAAYVSNNQLIIAGLDSNNRQVIVDGGDLSQSSNAQELREKQISSPVWFPDGKKLAFTLGGLNIYDLETGQYTTLIQNSSEKFESFSASMLSQDMTEILVKINMYETWQVGLYSIPNGTFKHIDELWSPIPFKWIDDQIYVIAKSDPSFGGKVGVWSINTLDNSIAKIILDNGYVLLSPEIVGEKMFYLYSSGADANTSQSVYSSSLDGSEQTQILAQTFSYPDSYTYVLWNSNASSFVGFIFIPSQGIRLELNYIDGTPPTLLANLPQVIHILPKWGP